MLAYFLLASGTHFRRKLVQLVGPSLTRKKDAVRILEEVDVQVQRYLLAMLLSNALVAVGTWLAFTALGVEQAGVWGVAAGVLHFIPYLGPLLLAVVSGIAAYLQFGSPLDALLVAGASLLVAGGIGFLFLTWLPAALAVNAAVSSFFAVFRLVMGRIGTAARRAAGGDHQGHCGRRIISRLANCSAGNFLA
jgi:predicted PurR-regulated permease PerM